MLSDNILVLELVESDTYDFFSLIELSAAIGWIMVNMKLERLCHV